MLSRVGWLALAATLAPMAAGARDAATFFSPDTTPDRAVLAQLAALGISRFSPPSHETDAWSLVASRHADIDLVWSATAPALEALSFAPTFRTKINHLPGADARLTDADAFARHVRETRRAKEAFFFRFVPRHLVLPRDQAELPQVFAETAKRFENEIKREDDEHIYQRFLVRDKPANGDDDALATAAVVTSHDELLAAMKAHHEGKSVEVTQYIEPYLIDGHKFQVGFYVAITSVDPLRIYTYTHPQIKIAKTAYPTRLKTDTDSSAYNFKEFIAPWDFPDLQKLFYEFPSADRPGTNAWTVLKRYMMLQGLDTTRLQKEIDAAIVTSIISSRGFLKSQIHKLKRTPGGANADQKELDDNFFELLRFDMELDDLGKPWLTRIHSNPSMAPHSTVFGSDAAIKNNLLFDLLNLVGVHPQAKPSFDEVFVPADTTYCAAKCQDDSRTWDVTCWSCPGGFVPEVARRLFDAKNEYARRGGFKLVFPSLDQDYTKFLDNTLSEHDVALNRYVKSLSAAYAESQDAPPVFNKVLTCSFREHCSGHGDCVNGQCVCDDEYEGATCYVPKDMEREQRVKEERAAAEAKARESWVGGMGNLWNRAPVPAAMAVNNVNGNANGKGGVAMDKTLSGQEQRQAHGATSGGMLFGGLFVAIFAYVGYQAYGANSGSGTSAKSS